MTFKIFRHSSNINALNEKGAFCSCDGLSNALPSVVAIGNFDGIHLGHQKVLQTAVIKAEELSAALADRCIQKESKAEDGGKNEGGDEDSDVYNKQKRTQKSTKTSLTSSVPAIMLTFQPHPKKVFLGDAMPQPITPFAEKCRLAREQGIDAVYAIRFSREYAKTSAEKFVQETLVGILKAKIIVVGDDFCFGKERSGSIEMLAELGKKYGFELISVPQVSNASGERYSSTLLREAITNGDVERAHGLTGRYFSIRTDMVEDDMLNLIGKIKHYTELKNGVYWAKISYTDGYNVNNLNIKHQVAVADIDVCTNNMARAKQGHNRRIQKVITARIKQAGGGNAVYSEKLGGVVPIVIKNGKFLIKPLPNLPNLAEGRVKIEFLKRLESE